MPHSNNPQSVAAAANRRGSLLMTLSMAGFAVEDAFIKAAARVMPLGQVLILMGVAGVLVFATMAARHGEAVLPRAFVAPAMLARSAFEVTGRLFYALAIALTPLSTTSAILQATPLVVVAAAALIFGEQVGWRRWLAVVIGFAGVLVILRPGLAGFSVLSWLAVVGMLGFAGRDLATRAAPKGLSNRQLGILGFAVLGLAGGIILTVTGGAVMPGLPAIGLTAGASVFGILGYHALTGAMRTGDVSAVTPFRYMRLIFALVLAMTVFGERPDHATLIGAAMIVGSGVFALSRRKSRV